MQHLTILKTVPLNHLLRFSLVYLSSDVLCHEMLVILVEIVE